MVMLEGRLGDLYGNWQKGGDIMIIDILGSSSSGNCYVLTDNNGNQILLECGIKYEKIVPHIDFEKLDCLLLSHYH